MLPTTLKIAKPLNFETKLKEYVLKNYDSSVFSDDVKNFLVDLQQNRNVISKMGEIGSCLELLRSNLVVVTGYINQLVILKSKMTFGKESHSAQIQFEWTDSLKGSKISSYNIYFEYYNCLYLLATMHFNIAMNMDKENPSDRGKDLLKDITKNYRNALALFELIKNEVPEKLNPKEVPSDMTSNYLEYCCTMCIINGQLSTIEFASLQKTKEDFIAKLSKGVSDLYGKAYNLCNEAPCSKYVSGEFKNFLLFSQYYQKSIMFFKFEEFYRRTFNEVGKGFGGMISYQEAGAKALVEAKKYAGKCEKYVKAADIEAQIQKEGKKWADMKDENERIYHEVIEDISQVKYESKIMIQPQMNTDLILDINNAEGLKIPNALDALVPSEVQDMIRRYKEKMMEEITSNLNQLENENTIKEFIASLKISPKLTGQEPIDPNSTPVDIENFLWSKIDYCQKLGGTDGLFKIIKAIEGLSKEMEDNINKCLQMMATEEREDSKYRMQFGNEKWIRKPSQMLTPNLINTLKKYLQTIIQTRQFDAKAKNEVVENARFFEMLGLPRAVLNSKIPGRPQLAQNKPVVFTKEEKAVKTLLAELEDLSKKVMEIIHGIFENLNKDLQYPPLFVEVLNSKTTELAIFEKEKANYQTKFEQLKKYSEEVKAKKEELAKTNEKVQMASGPQSQESLNEQAMAFKKNLDTYANLFKNKHDKLIKGFEYYKGMNAKLNEVLSSAYHYVQEREKEKAVLISTIQGTSFAPSSGTYMNEKSFYDPNKNLITNMSVKGFTLPSQNRPQQSRLPQQGGYNQQQFNPNQHYGNQQNTNYYNPNK